MVCQPVQGTVDAFGRLDIVINNSGGEEAATLLDQSAGSWDRVIDTNLRVSTS
jgi:NAD(P)-dependent dehydrogenase (short-subunit alcohol dehydrogenase family)